MRATIDEVSVGIRGTSLPVRRLSDRLGHDPFVARGKDRQIINVLDSQEISFCSFRFALEVTDLSEFSGTICEVLTCYRDGFQIIRQTAKYGTQATLSTAIQIHSAAVLSINTDCIKQLSRHRLSFWADCYFEGYSDIIDPPDALASSAPANTIWFGGLFDVVTVFSADQTNDPTTILDAYWSGQLSVESVRLTCPDQDDFSAALITLIEQEVSGAAPGKGEGRSIWCIAEAYRHNRSLEIDYPVLNKLRKGKLSLKLIVIHAGMSTC